MADRVGVEIELIGYSKFRSQLEQANKIIKDATGKNYQFNFASTPRGLRDQANAVKRELRSIQNQIERFEKNKHKIDPIDFERAMSELKEYQSALRGLARDLRTAQELNPIINYKAAFTRGKSMWGAAGTSIETFGNALTNLGRNPVSQVLIGGLRQLGAALSGLMYQGLSQSVARYNTLAQYPKLMEEMGYSADQAAKSTERLRDSVRGLPTKLDDIVAEANKYVSAMGDIERGTDLAIAANYAYLASSSSEQQRMRGNIQLNNLVSGAKLTRKQWMALWASMPLAMAKIGEEMGYTTSESFQAALYANKISNTDFLDAMINTDDLRKLADISKQSLSGAITNLQTSFSIAGANLIGALNEGLKSATGKDLPATIYDIGVAIQDYSKKMVEWVKANPQVIREWVDKLKSIDFVGFIKAFAKGVADGAKLLGAAAKFLPGEGAFGWLLGFAPIAGRVVTVFGQLVKATSPLGGVIGLVVAYKGAGKFFGWLSNLFTGIGGASKVAEAVDVASAAGTMGKAAPALVSMAKNMAIIAGVVGLVTASAVAIKIMFKQFQEIGKLNWEKVAIGFAGFAGAIGAIATAAVIIGAAGSALAGAAVQIAIGAAAIEAIVLAIGLIVTTLTWFTKTNVNMINDIAKSIENTLNAMDRMGKVLDNFHWSGDAKVAEMVGELVKTAWEISDDVGGLIGGWYLDKMTDRVDDIVNNISDVVRSLSDISTMVANIAPPQAGASDAVREIAGLVEDIIETFTSNQMANSLDLGILDFGTIGTGESSNLQKIINDFVGIIGSFANMSKSLSEANEAVKGLLVETGEGKLKVINDIKVNISNFARELGGLFDAIINDLDQSTGQSGRVAEITTSFTTTLSNLKALGEVFPKIEEAISPLFEIVSGQGENLQNKMGQIKEMIHGFSLQLGNLFEQIYLDLQGIGTETASDIQTKTTSLQTALNSLVAMVETFTSFQTKMTEMSEVADLTTISESIKNLISEVTPIAEELGELEVGEDMSGKVANLLTATQNLVGVVEQIKAVQVAMEGVVIGEGGIAGKITQFVGELNSALGSITADEGLIAKIALFKQALTNLVGAMGLLNGGGGMLASVQILAAAIRDIGTAFDEVTTTITGIGKQWIDALIQGLEMRRVVDHIRSAMTNINLYNQGMMAGSTFRRGLMSQLKNIHVTISVGANTSSAWASINRMNGATIGVRAALLGNQALLSGASTGGMITPRGRVLYRALGGSIFRPRGSDTVPAMLSPGEYIVRRSSVKALGTDFMQSINHMDIAGAMSALSTRMGGMLPQNRANVINNTTNNNQSVTQNINTNNPNYSYRRAGRFVRALS